jgi:hypothetical protein
VELVDSFDTRETEFVPLITVVRASLFDEMECEGFIEIVYVFLSMTEIILQ